MRAARWRRSRLARRIPAELRDQFDRDGFLVIPDYLSEKDFSSLRDAVLNAEHDCREQRQGDTVTRRIAVGPDLLARIPALARMLDSDRWKGVMAYVSSTRSTPLYYIQTISAGVFDGPRDPQLQLHSDTFHPSLKAWLFLNDVPEDGRPLTYVAGSHRLTPERAEWERRRSSTVVAEGDRLSQRGSLRIAPDELAALGLPQPTPFSVKANTMVAIDTCGFHARADSDRPTQRVELWAYNRRSPFLPWTGGDLLSWRPIAIRRAEWLGTIVDWLAQRGWMTQHWRRSGPRAPLQP